MMMPCDVSGLDIAFGGDISRLLPPYADIPDAFKHGDTKWNRLFAQWFYSGVSHLVMTPKPGIDQAKALRHICAVMVSFEPKHEHKEAGIAVLLNEWFADATWQAGERRAKR